MLALAALLAGAFWAGARYSQRQAPAMRAPQIAGMLWPTQPTLEPFSLEDARGGSFDTSSLRGKWTLLFLGYTHCPDICPTTLATLKGVNNALRDFPTFARDGQVVFVSVDYERDKADVLRSYVEYFEPSFRAASAAPAQLHLLLRRLDMTAVKTTSDDSPDYWYEHSSEIVLLGPDLRVLALFDYPHDAGDIAARLRAIIKFMHSMR